MARRGRPPHWRTTLDDRFWALVDRQPGDGCWVWTGALNNHGYGKCSWNGRTELAHVVAYVKTRGPVLPGLELDHLCRNRRCVRPDHLQPVSPAENQARKAGRRQAEGR